MTTAIRDALFFVGLAVILAGVFAVMGSAYTLRMLVEAGSYAILALGLTIQWGYAGLFNAGIMGFIALAAFMTVFVSFPINTAFWASDGPALLGMVLLKALVVTAIVVGASQLHRLGLPKRLRTILTLIAALGGYLYVASALDPVATYIESTAGFVGGFGLPVWLGWSAGAAAAGVLAYFIGKICLGLRSDYLAIATLGIAEIVKALLKNADWLTRGTLTVSPLPWPVPTPAEIGFIGGRAAYLSLTAITIVAIYVLVQRAYRAPWGRMMRAIRDNEIAAEAMGKDVNRRRLEIFILGCVIMGFGGAMLITFTGIFDPAGYLPLNHTFLVWVMVILGGAGNNLGAIFGALFVYILWTMSEPAALYLFDLLRVYGTAWFDWVPPSDLDSRALQMRVFIIGLTIALVLRYAPRGLIPERIVKHD